MIDLVVVNYRTVDDLLNFVGSVDVSLPFSLTVVHVDPTESDISAVFPDFVNVLVHGENVGYAKACNNAASLLDGDFLAFFNADTMLRPGVVEHCVELLGDPSVGVVGPKQLDQRGRVTHAGIFGTLDAPRHRGWMQSDNPMFDDVVDAVTVSGAAYFTKRSVWDDLSACSLFRELHPDVEGAFLPTRHYYEETWYSYHAQSHGYRVLYTGVVSMVHLWHRASPVGGWAERQMKESRKLFVEACDYHGILHD